jgi:uncharacterized phage protein (TIGR02220 family)
MFAQTIIDSDAFLTMSLSAQALYFHLSMRGDDEGFVNKPKSVMRTIGANEDDLKILIAKNFIIPFDSGIVVIKHWKIHNYIRGDRLKETVYQDEKSQLEEKENGSYTLIEDCQSSGSHMTVKCQHRLGKVSIGKDSIDILSEDEPQTESHPYSKIINYLNTKAGTQYKSTSKKTQTLIKARFSERFTEQDFYKVIDNKVATWLNDSKMNKFLRPETLFGTKFEGYLNEKGGSNGQNSGNNQQNKSGGYDTSKVEYKGDASAADKEYNF